MVDVTLGDLLAWEPRLRPYPSPGALPNGWDRRDVSWAVAARSTLPILPPLRGHELIVLPRRAVEQVGTPFASLLRDLFAQGVAGVVVDEDVAARSPPGATESTATFLLQGAPVSADLEGDLNRMLTERRGEMYRVGTELGRALTALTTAGADVGRVVEKAATSIRVPVAVLDPDGSVIAATDEAQDGTSDSVLDVRLVTGETVRIGPVGPGRAAIARIGGERIAVAVEAALARPSHLRPRGRARAAAIGALLREPSPLASVDVPARANALALPADGLFRVVLARPGSVVPVWLRRLGSAATVHESTPIDGAGGFLIEYRTGSAAGPGAGRLAPLPAFDRGPTESGPDEVQIAASGAASGLEHVPTAARQARYVLALLRSGTCRREFAAFDDVDTVGAYRLLYPLWGTAAAASFASDVLGELDRDDRRGDLQRTLLVFLEEGGSHVATAACLGIHRNTLAYRLRSIAAVTGRDPSDPVQRLAIHLALLMAALPDPSET